jgi:hypothetical protein
LSHLPFGYGFANPDERQQDSQQQCKQRVNEEHHNGNDDTHGEQATHGFLSRRINLVRVGKLV